METYFAGDHKRAVMLVQFQALWRSMTADERETWARFVTDSKDDNMEPLRAFLAWRERRGL